MFYFSSYLFQNFLFVFLQITDFEPFRNFFKKILKLLNGLCIFKILFLKYIQWVTLTHTLVTSIDYILWTILVTFTLLLHYLIIKYNLLSVLIMYVPNARPGRTVHRGRLPSPEHDNYWDAMQISSVVIHCFVIIFMFCWNGITIWYVFLQPLHIWPLTPHKKWVWFLFLISKKERKSNLWFRSLA